MAGSQFIFQSIVLMVFIDSLIATQGVPIEYCLTETFQPRCAHGEVIVMQHARYGRMKIGKCVKRDKGSLGCASNELATLDGKCSGKQECDVLIIHLQENIAPKLDCLDELTAYLEATYKCDKVYIPRNKRCTSPEQIDLDKNAGFLASSITKQTSCGLHASPWILQVAPGQKIDVELIDFGWTNGTKVSHRCAKNYGYILDMESDDVIHICGGGQRERQLYTSSGYSVQVVIDVTHSDSFLLKYEALGCPDYSLPEHAWMEKENNSLIIGCHSSDETWTVRCVDNMWLGIVGNCKPASTTTKSALQVTTGAEVPKSKLPIISDNHVVVFTMGCITILICCVIIIAGIYCTKRYEAKLTTEKESTLPHFPNGTLLLPQRTSVMYRPVNQGSTPQGTMDLPPYSMPLAKEDRIPSVPKRTSSYGGTMPQSMVASDYLDPQGDGNSVQYYILENPTESGGNDQMYQSIHMMNSMDGNQSQN